MLTMYDGAGDPRRLAGEAVGRLSRRGLLRGVAGVAALGALGAACRTGAGSSPGAPAGSSAGAAPPAAPAPTAPGAASVALARRQPLKICWTAVTGAQSAIWVAQETGAWQELGIDSELVRLGSSSQMAAALQAGEIDGGVLDWALGFQFIAQGGNAREVAAVTNRQVFAVVSVPNITRPQDAAGKRWGITRLGSATHTAALLALQEWNLRPQDVQFVAVQEVPAIFTAMQAGGVDVGVMSPPTSTRALQAGLHQLIDLATEGPEYPSIGMCILDRHIRENPELVRAYVAGYAMGVARYRQNRDQALDVMRKYLQLDDEAILQSTYDNFTRALAYPPTLPMASLARVREDVVREDPRVASVSVDDVAVARFADELAAQGFYTSLG
jgi:NitT/TauT family transport system substrate-binding protein